MAPEHGVYLYFDWDGNPFDTLDEFGRYFDRTFETHLVAFTRVGIAGRYSCAVRAHYTGIAATDDIPPKIFELLLNNSEGVETAREKYTTAAEVKKHHDLLVRYLLAKHKEFVVLESFTRPEIDLLAAQPAPPESPRPAAAPKKSDASS